MTFTKTGVRELTKIWRIFRMVAGFFWEKEKKKGRVILSIVDVQMYSPHVLMSLASLLLSFSPWYVTISYFLDFKLLYCFLRLA